MTNNDQKIIIFKLSQKKKGKPSSQEEKNPQAFKHEKILNSVWYCHKDRNIDQWNKTESPAINPQT